MTWAFRSVTFAAALLAASINLTGCVIMPFPPFRKVAEGTEIRAGDLDWLRVGETSRTQVRARLGPPDVDFIDQHTIAYAWSGIRAVIFAGSGGLDGSSGWGGGSAPLMMRRALLVRFDAAGRVVAFSIVNRPMAAVPYGAPGSSPDALVMDWRTVLDQWLAEKTPKAGKSGPAQNTDEDQ
jgi:hypothetical protein